MTIRVIFNGQQNTYFIYFYTTVETGYYVVIKNLTFQNFRGVAIGSGSDTGSQAHHFAVLGCAFENFSPQLSGALNVGGGHHYIFSDNRMKNIGDPRLGGSPPPDSQHFIYIGGNSQYGVIDGNFMEGNSGFGIHFYGHHDYQNTNQQTIVRRSTVINATITDLVLAGPNYLNGCEFSGEPNGCEFSGEPKLFPFALMEAQSERCVRCPQKNAWHAGAASMTKYA